MKSAGFAQKGLMLSGLALLLLVVLPATTMSQGRGRGRGQWRGDGWNDKKCGKFVNCHDARDGRWDGRGPRRDQDVFRNRHSGRRWDDERGRSFDWRNRFDRQGCATVATLARVNGDFRCAIGTGTDGLFDIDAIDLDSMRCK